jgi:hypothetical protein
MIFSILKQLPPNLSNDGINELRKNVPPREPSFLSGAIRGPELVIAKIEASISVNHNKDIGMSTRSKTCSSYFVK